MDNVMWQIQAWLIQLGWRLAEAWDSIGGWTGVILALCCGAAIGTAVWVVVIWRYKARQSSVVSTAAQPQEPITQPIQALTAEMIASQFTYNPIAESGEWEGYLELTEEEWENWHDPEKHFPPGYSAVVEAEGVVAKYLKGLKQ